MNPVAGLLLPPAVACLSRGRTATGAQAIGREAPALSLLGSRALRCTCKLDLASGRKHIPLFHTAVVRHAFSPAATEAFIAAAPLVRSLFDFDDFFEIMPCPPQAFTCPASRSGVLCSS